LKEVFFLKFKKKIRLPSTSYEVLEKIL